MALQRGSQRVGHSGRNGTVARLIADFGAVFQEETRQRDIVQISSHGQRRGSPELAVGSVEDRESGFDVDADLQERLETREVVVPD
jgi:hypothetical protein